MLAVLPDADALNSLGREDLRRLAHECGNSRLKGIRRFAAILPMVARYEIYLDDKMADLYEWSVKVGGCTRQEVDQVLALYRRIGRYSCIWSLLAAALVSVAKLERVAPHVTADNAGWWAALLPTLTWAEIEEIIKAQTPHALKRPVAAPEPSLPGGRRQPELFGSCSPPIHAPAPAAEAPSGAPPGDPAASDTGEDNVVAPIKVRTTVELSALGERRLRELQQLHERLYGHPIGLGDIITALAHDALIRGELPGRHHALAPSCPATGSGEAATTAEPGDPAGKALAHKPFVSRVVEVVVNLADVGWKTMRTAAGWILVTDGDLCGLRRIGKPIALKELREKAIADESVFLPAGQLAAKRQELRTSGEYFISAVSGGYCEEPYCNRLKEAIHHHQRVAEGGTNHPDNMFATCDIHHAMDHDHLFVGHRLADRRVIRPGEPPTVANEADRRYQDARRQALASRCSDVEARREHLVS